MYEPLTWFTWLVIIATSVVSFLGFRTYGFEQKYIFSPERILAGKEYYRLVSSAFLHADFRHLFLNMLSLYFFGRGVEARLGSGQFSLIYFGAILGGNLLSLFVHRHHDYRAYGASGGVCGILFASILISPGGSISLYFLPIWIPNWLYAVGFLAGSFYGMKEQNRGNIGHDAHLGGAIIGFLISAGMNPGYVRYSPWIFAIVLVVSILLLVYLWSNPMMLALSSFLPARSGKTKKASLPPHKKRAREMDAILEKISRSGIESLTVREKALLESASAEYRRRAQSTKPKSGLAI